MMKFVFGGNQTKKKKTCLKMKIFKIMFIKLNLRLKKNEEKNKVFLTLFCKNESESETSLQRKENTCHIDLKCYTYIGQSMAISFWAGH